MLLYTRLAPPKAPKKRSRAGCAYCKEKKKKCNEARPQCARCLERDQECVYEPVKPRQRRKRETGGRFANDSGSHAFDPSLHLADDDDDDIFDQWDEEIARTEERIDPRLLGSLEGFEEPSLGRPMQLALHWRDGAAFSPVESVTFESQLSGDAGYHVDGIDSSGLVVARSGSIHQHLAPIGGFVDTRRLEFLYPSFSEFSDRPNRRALVDHFCNILSHLIVFKEDSGNPFQKLVLPLCQKSDSVMNAIYALASAHLEYRGIENAEKSVYFHNQSIQGLARLIEQGAKANKNELLAAIMLLVYYEVLVQRGRSNIVEGHLRGAMTVMSTHADSLDTTGVFLERAFRFYDVIAALSLGTPPLSNPLAAGCLAPFPPLDVPESPLSNVDTLLGMATTLWPIIHRLSTLRSLKTELDATVATNQDPAKISALRTEFETTSHAIDNALKKWQPSLPTNYSLDEQDGQGADSELAAERARLQSILNNALAYRHSAFVYLYRAIYGYSRRHALVQRHAHVSLTHCVATVVNEGPMGALLWPLFVAACEAVSLGDRDLARQAFVAIHRRQGMMNIERAWVIIQEVWRRADLEEASSASATATATAPQFAGSASNPTFKGRDLWRRVSEDMGVTIVFG